MAARVPKPPTATAFSPWAVQPYEPYVRGVIAGTGLEPVCDRGSGFCGWTRREPVRGLLVMAAKAAV